MTVPELRALEESLWRAETRYDPDYVGRIFAPDFREFGRSGRSYAFAEAAAVSGDVIECELPLPAFEVSMLSDDVALATYQSRVRYDGVLQVSNRSSVWVRTDDGWRLRFHQGTPTEP